MPEDKIKTLYDALSGSHSLGTYDEFKQKLQDEGKRRIFYDAMSSYNLGTYEDFSSKVSLDIPKQVPSQTMKVPTTPMTQGVEQGMSGVGKLIPSPEQNIQVPSTSQSGGSTSGLVPSQSAGTNQPIVGLTFKEAVKQGYKPSSPEELLAAEKAYKEGPTVVTETKKEEPDFFTKIFQDAKAEKEREERDLAERISSMEIDPTTNETIYTETPTFKSSRAYKLKFGGFLDNYSGEKYIEAPSSNTYDGYSTFNSRAGEDVYLPLSRGIDFWNDTKKMNEASGGADQAAFSIMGSNIIGATYPQEMRKVLADYESNLKKFAPEKYRSMQNISAYAGKKVPFNDVYGFDNERTLDWYVHDEFKDLKMLINEDPEESKKRGYVIFGQPTKDMQINFVNDALNHQAKLINADFNARTKNGTVNIKYDDGTTAVDRYKSALSEMTRISNEILNNSDLSERIKKNEAMLKKAEDEQKMADAKYEQYYKENPLLATTYYTGKGLLSTIASVPRKFFSIPSIVGIDLPEFEAKVKEGKQFEKDVYGGVRPTELQKSILDRPLNIIPQATEMIADIYLMGKTAKGIQGLGVTSRPAFFASTVMNTYSDYRESTYDQLIKAGVPEVKAKEAADANALMGSLFTGMIESVFPGMEKVIAGGVKKEASEELIKSLLKGETVSESMKKVGMSYLKEMPKEQAEEILNLLTDKMTNAKTNYDLGHEYLDADVNAKEIGETMVMTGVVSGFAEMKQFKTPNGLQRAALFDALSNEENFNKSLQNMLDKGLIKEDEVSKLQEDIKELKTVVEGLPESVNLDTQKGMDLVMNLYKKKKIKEEGKGAYVDEKFAQEKERVMNDKIAKIDAEIDQIIPPVKETTAEATAVKTEPKTEVKAETKTGEQLVPSTTIQDNIKPEDRIPVQEVFKKEPVTDIPELQTQETRRKLAEENQEKIKTEKINISEITPTQTSLDKNILESESKSEANPLLLKNDQGIFPIDGHHRIADEISKGATEINADVIDLTSSQKKEPQITITTNEGPKEHKIGDKFYSEKEFSEIIDKPEIAKGINEGSIAVSVNNPSTEIQTKLETLKSPEYGKEAKTETGKEADVLNLSSRTDEDIEKRMAELEKSNYSFDSPEAKEFNMLEKEMEKRERDSVFNVPLNKASDAIDALLEKEKNKPNGYGAFIEKRDARESKEVIDRYSDPSKLSDKEIMDDFVDALRGNPSTWYADGLKLRESANEASKRGITFEALIEKAKSIYTKEGYDEQTAINVVKGFLEPIFKTAKTESTKVEPLKTNQNAETVRSNEGQVQETGNVRPGSETESRQNLQLQPSEGASNSEKQIKEVSPAEKTAGEITATQEEAAKPEGEVNQRKFAGQVVNDKEVRPEVKSSMKEKNYESIPNDITISEADAFIKENGLEESEKAVLNKSNNMPFRVRAVIGMQLIRDLNDKGSKEKDEVKKNQYYDRAAEIADDLAKKGTEMGQGIQAFSLWSATTVDGMIRSGRKAIDQTKRSIDNDTKATRDKIKSNYKKAVKKSADKTVDNLTSKSSSNVKTFGMTKDEIKDKKKAALEKFRNATKGGPLTSGGLNKEAIEAAGEYGYYLFIDGIRSFKEWAAEMKKSTGLNDEAVSDIWNSKVLNSNKTLAQLATASNLSDIVFKHYTEPGETSLSEKVQKELGIDEKSANAISKEIESEYEKISKTEIEKNLDKGLPVSADPRKITRTRKAINKLKKAEEPITEDVIKESFYDSYGIKDLDPKIIEKLKDLDKQREAAPEGSFLKNNITVEMLSEISKQSGIKWSDVMWGIWYANVLSGPETQLLNATSNAQNLILEFGVSAIEQGLVQKDPKAVWGGFKAILGGLTKGLTEAQSILAEGPSQAQIESMKLESKNALENITFKGGKFNPYNYYKYVPRFMAAIDAIGFSGAQNMMAHEVARDMAKEEGLKGEELETRTNEILGWNKEAYEDAQTQATEEVNAVYDAQGKKKEGTAYRRDVRRRKNEILLQKSPVEIQDKATSFGRFATYNYTPKGWLGAVAETITGINRKIPPARLIVPFVRVVANVLNQQLDYTPYGYLRALGINASSWTEKYGKGTSTRQNETSKEQNRELIKATIGTTLMVALYTLAAMHDDEEDPAFDIIGKGPSDFNKKNQLYAQGWKPYSIKIGDKYISYQYSPLGLGFSFIGNWRDNEKYKELSNKSMFTKSVFALKSSGSALLEMSFLQGLSGFLEGLTTSSDPEKTVEHTLKSTARTGTSFFVPNFLRQIDNIWVDNTIYNTDDLTSYILADIPFVRSYSGLKPKLNILGEPVMKDASVFRRFIANKKQSGHWKLLADKKIFLSGASPNTKNHDKTPMTSDQFYRYVEYSGEMMKEFLIENEATIREMDDDKAESFVNKKLSMFRRKAKLRIHKEMNGEDTENGESDEVFE